jgi:hypothetical protein
MMRWLRWGFGVLLVVVGLVWMLQGFNVVKGSSMSGDGGWVVGGVVAVLCGLWVLWEVAKPHLRLSR